MEDQPSHNNHTAKYYWTEMVYN